MNCLPRYLLYAAISAFGVAFAGCGTVRIVRAPLVSPVVLPAPQSFKLNVAVKNFGGTRNSASLWLRVYSEYWPAAQPRPGQPPCSQLEYLSMGILAPGQSWARSGYQIDRGTACSCVKDACVGQVWLSLHVSPSYAPHISGTNTGLNVNWAASGNLDDMTISEF